MQLETLGKIGLHSPPESFYLHSEDCFNIFFFLGFFFLTSPFPFITSCMLIIRNRKKDLLLIPSS